MNDRLENLWSLVREIPFGRCASYGDIGRALDHPISGLLVGRWMRSSIDGVPWWRVVLKSGAIATDKLDPELGMRQRRLLEAEGVPFVADRVDMRAVGWSPD